MNFAQNLLEEKLPTVEGLESTLLSQSHRGFNVRQQNEALHVQIHYVGGHGVTSARNPNSDDIYVFDSLTGNAPFLSSILKLQISQIHRTVQKAISVRIPRVQQQSKSSNNCGLYAIAYATELCFNGSIEIASNFDESVMRPHLVEC